MSRAAATTAKPRLDRGDLTGLLDDGLLGAPAERFAILAARLRDELAPRNLLEGLQVELILVALTLLRRAIVGLTDDEADPVRALRVHAQAHKMLSQALREFHRLRRQAPAGAATSQQESVPADPPAVVAPSPTAAPAVAAVPPAIAGRPSLPSSVPPFPLPVTLLPSAMLAALRNPSPPPDDRRHRTG